jgi:hypothetical protein
MILFLRRDFSPVFLQKGKELGTKSKSIHFTL